MKKQTRSHRKRVHARTKRRIPKHLRVHMVFVYSSIGIFALTGMFAAAHILLQPLAEKNNAYYATPVLGIQQENTSATEQESLFKQIIDFVMPK